MEGIVDANATIQDIHNPIIIDHSTHFDFSFMFVVQIIFYLVVAFKVLQCIFAKKGTKVRRPLIQNIRDRIYRKYIVTHCELIKDFTEEDRNMMEITLNNTVKNAQVALPVKERLPKENQKKVGFSI